MLTPAFELSQEDDFLTLSIKARFARVSETEIFVDGKSFKFYSKPYFLRLTLPGALVEDGRETATYDSNKGVFVIRIPKEIPGEKFDGLDMLTKLMAPSGANSASEPSIQTIAPQLGVASNRERQAQEEEDDEDSNDADDEVEEEISWEVDQTPCLLDEDQIVGPVTYGFAGRRSGVFSRLQEELCSIVDVPDPDGMTAKERREGRKQEEEDKFDDEHYLADLYQDDMIQPLLDYKPPWQTLLDPSSETNLIKFSEAEKDRMLNFPNKEFLLDKTMEKVAYMGLLDIIFAYAYNHRIMEGENSVESAWTICKLSSTLSWLDTDSTPRDVLVSSVRRSLCYPLYRHWKLAIATVRDVKTIFHLGRNQILKSLLEVHRLLGADEPHYILNELYITDYCIWLQAQPHKKIKLLASAVDKVEIFKEDMELDLEELEAAARCVLEENVEQDTASVIEMQGYPQLLQNTADDIELQASRRSSGEDSGPEVKENYLISETGHSQEDSIMEKITEITKDNLYSASESSSQPEEKSVPDNEHESCLANKMASLMIEKSRTNAMGGELDSDDDSDDLEDRSQQICS